MGDYHYPFRIFLSPSFYPSPHCGYRMPTPITVCRYLFRHLPWVLPSSRCGCRKSTSTTVLPLPPPLPRVRVWEAPSQTHRHTLTMNDEARVDSAHPTLKRECRSQWVYFLTLLHTHTPSHNPWTLPHNLNPLFPHSI